MKTRITSVVLVTIGIAACEVDPSGTNVPQDQEIGVVLSSLDRLLTIFAVDDPLSTTQIGLGPDGSPVTLAIRNQIAVIPMGVLPTAAVVDLAQGRLTATVALPANSGATGVAFISDSIALVANPGRNM